MKLHAKQDDQGKGYRRSKFPKLYRRFKNKVERKRAKLDPECQPFYGKYAGWVT